MANEVNTSDRWLTEAEAAIELGLRQQTLAAWRVRGQGPRFAKIGRSIRYRSSEISRYIESRTCANTAQAAALAIA